MNFLAPQLLLGLLLIPVAIGFYLWAQRRRSKYAVRFTNLALLSNIAPRRPSWRRHLPPVLYLGAIAALLIGLARPTMVVQVPREDATVILTMDVSGSMRATDVSPTRLDAARASALVVHRPAARRTSASASWPSPPSRSPWSARRPTRTSSRPPSTACTARDGTAMGDALMQVLDIAEKIQKDDAAETPDATAAPERLDRARPVRRARRLGGAEPPDRPAVEQAAGRRDPAVRRRELGRPGAAARRGAAGQDPRRPDLHDRPRHRRTGRSTCQDNFGQTRHPRRAARHRDPPADRIDHGRAGVRRARPRRSWQASTTTSSRASATPSSARKSPSRWSGPGCSWSSSGPGLSAVWFGRLPYEPLGPTRPSGPRPGAVALRSRATITEPGVPMPAFDVDALRDGVPGARPPAGWPAGRLPRRAGRDAGPAAGDRRGRRLLPRHERELGRRVHDERGDRRDGRRGARGRRRLPRGGLARRDQVRRQHVDAHAPPRALDRGDAQGPGDEILVTTLDHEANVSTWRAMAADRGVTVKAADIRLDDVTLDLEDLESKLGPRTKLVAVGYASNAVGSVNPVREIVARAHEVGALTFIDAVAFAPHGPIDVAALDTDFLACSAYKWFGPHVGVLYGKTEVLDRLPAYKVRPAHDRYETGTPNFEGDRRHARRDRLPPRRRARVRRRRRGARAPRTPASAGVSWSRRWSRSPPTSANWSAGCSAGLGAIARRDDPRHHRSGAVRRPRPDRVGVDRGRPSAGGRRGARARRDLRLGRRLLRDRADRAARPGRGRRGPPPRARPLQHGRRGGPDARGARTDRLRAEP